MTANPVYDCDRIIGMEGFILDISGLEYELNEDTKNNKE